MATTRSTRHFASLPCRATQVSQGMSWGNLARPPRLIRITQLLLDRSPTAFDIEAEAGKPNRALLFSPSSRHADWSLGFGAGPRTCRRGALVRAGLGLLQVLRPVALARVCGTRRRACTGPCSHVARTPGEFGRMGWRAQRRCQCIGWRPGARCALRRPPPHASLTGARKALITSCAKAQLASIAHYFRPLASPPHRTPRHAGPLVYMSNTIFSALRGPPTRYCVVHPLTALATAQEGQQEK